MPKILAFYLPQYYPTPENDEWWGKGFTEWTNVGKAKSLFRGHYQPKVPADLSYYDLRVPFVREEQAKLAKKAGVDAFCYWHYWFGNGKRLLSEVFEEVLNSGKPDYSFCLGWANHSWFAKTWDKDSKKDKLLIEQTYPGAEDAKMHFGFLLRAFSDKRYVKINNKPFLYIFDPKGLPSEYVTLFRKWTKEAGFDDIYLVANIGIQDDPQEFINKGYNSVVINRILYYDNLLSKAGSTLFTRSISIIKRTIVGTFLNRPKLVMDYSKYYKMLVTPQEKQECVLPEIVPGWDHSPRSGKKGLIYINNTPQVFYQHCKDALECVRGKSQENQIIMLKSWNEWGEGNYMEPDLKHGHAYIEMLRKAIDEYEQ